MIDEKKTICDILHCNGAFFDEHVYIEHLRHIHKDDVEEKAEENHVTIQMKDASRVRPVQTGPRPASKRKVWVLFRVQCQQARCKEETRSYFKTRAEYNKHVADAHSGKATTGCGGGGEGDNKTNNSKTPDRRRSKPEEDGDGESPMKKGKMKEDQLKSMISEASYSTLLKDLDSLQKEGNKTSTPVRPGTRASARQESSTSSTSSARASPRRKVSKKGNECEDCRKKFGTSVSQCLCTEVDVHHSQARVKIQALNTSVVSQV